MSDSNDPQVTVLISQAPDDQDEKKEWVRHLMRLQVAMWLPAACAHCGKEYTTVDDWIARNPFGGYPRSNDHGLVFVDSTCWAEYIATRELKQ